MKRNGKVSVGNDEGTNEGKKKQRRNEPISKAFSSKGDPKLQLGVSAFPSVREVHSRASQDLIIALLTADEK